MAVGTNFVHHQDVDPKRIRELRIAELIKIARQKYGRRIEARHFTGFSDRALEDAIYQARVPGRPIVLLKTIIERIDNRHRRRVAPTPPKYFDRMRAASGEKPDED